MRSGCVVCFGGALWACCLHVEGNLLGQAAKIISFPGLYWIVQSYFCNWRNMHCNWGVAACMGFFWIIPSSLWSPWMIMLPSVKMSVEVFMSEASGEALSFNVGISCSNICKGYRPAIL